MRTLRGPVKVRVFKLTSMKPDSREDTAAMEEVAEIQPQEMREMVTFRGTWKMLVKGNLWESWAPWGTLPKS
jgi:hypothetical protein